MAQPVGDGGKSGRVLLTRQMNGGEAHDTYTAVSYTHLGYGCQNCRGYEIPREGDAVIE